MALLKPKELRAMRPEDMIAKFKELSDELMHERGVAAMGGAPASPGRIRAIRTNIARIHTIRRELELAEEKKKAEAPAETKKPTEKKAKKGEKKTEVKEQEEKK
jgi:large subunit ribosomal protein L29